jgi:hypothetical protein
MKRDSLRNMVVRAVIGVDVQQPSSLAHRQARRDFAGAALAVVSVTFAVLLTAAQAHAHAHAEPASRSANPALVEAAAPRAGGLRLGMPTVPGTDIGDDSGGDDDGDDDRGGDDGGAPGGGMDRGDTAGLGHAGHARHFEMSFGRQIGPLSGLAGVEVLAEDRTVLGARFAPALGVRGADSVLLNGAADWMSPFGLVLGAAWRRDFTQVRGGGLAAGGSRLTTSGWALAATRFEALAEGDSLSLRLSQPLRVAGTPIDGNLPFAWTSAGAGWLGAAGPLLPEARETSAELAWHAALGEGLAGASLFVRRHPGNRADLPDDKGLGLSWSQTF